MYSNSDNSPAYQNLNDIRLRKAQLLTDITKESNQIENLWNDVFHKTRNSSTPTKRVSNFMSTGMGIADAVLLGWKLYRRLNDKPVFFNFFGKNKRRKR